MRADGDSVRFTFEAPGELGRFIAPKGSVTIDGTSLTVNEVEDVREGSNEARTRFGVNIIPHTQAVTTWGQARVGNIVNLEIDRSEEHTSELQSLMRISYAVFCLK